MGKSKNSDVQLSQLHPLARQKTVIILENRKGEVVALDSINFGIRPDEGGAVLLAVNLPDELRKAGTMIKFSGHVKEGEPTELWMGQPFLLSHVEKI